MFWQAESWLDSLERDRASVEREFEAEYGYPLPWCEVASIEEVESLTWRLSENFGVDPPTINIAIVLGLVWDRMSTGRSAERSRFPGSPARDFEAIDSAVARLGVPRDGVVLLTNCGHVRGEPRGQRALRIRMKSVIDSVFWNEDTFVIDEDARWVLVSMHTWPAFVWKV